MAFWGPPCQKSADDMKGQRRGVLYIMKAGRIATREGKGQCWGPRHGALSFQENDKGKVIGLGHRGLGGPTKTVIN